MMKFREEKFDRVVILTAEDHGELIEKIEELAKRTTLIDLQYSVCRRFKHYLFSALALVKSKPRRKR